MDSRELPYISVIITAYNRKEFLLNAIKSAVNQTLDKKYYEIIVIKNFQDENIDNYLLENNIKGIISDDISLGGKLNEALNVAKGNVISFLEDDDLFLENKLDTVHNKFKKDANIVYYHNRHVPINKDGKTIEVKIKYSPDFNMSCISVRKSVLNLHNIKTITYGQDTFIFFSAIDSGKNIIAGKEKLTCYMRHNGASQIETENINEFIRVSNLHIRRDRDCYKFFEEIFISKNVKNFIKQRTAHFEIFEYIFGNTKKPSNVLKVFKSSNSFSYNLKVFLVYLLVRIHYNFRYIVINKLFHKWNTHFITE